MSRFLVTWEANPSVWPTDSKQALAVLEAATGGGDRLLSSGAAKEIGWLSAQEGFAIFEADSKDSVLGMVQGFFPYYSQDVREIVPWDKATKAILSSARAASSG
jgi:hypothetical protein